jgi:PAS domain S-box-containing protein/diguanylate cyclase (GGDEF)-like protein
MIKQSSTQGGAALYPFARTTTHAQTLDSVALLAQAVQHASDAVVVTDATLERPGPFIVFVNPAFCAMSGYSPDEVLGQSPRMLQGPRTNRDTLARLRTCLSQGMPFDGETINYRKDGTPFYVEWHISPIRDRHGTITHFVSVQRNVTERVYAQLLARDQCDLLEQMIHMTPLEMMYPRIVEMVQRQLPGLLVAMRITDGEQQPYTLAPDLPAAYCAASAAAPLTDSSASPYAMAMSIGHAVVVPDVWHDMRWPEWRTLALAHGIGACWITPIIDSSSLVQGVIACYSREPLPPTDHDHTLLEMACQMTALVIEQHHLNEQIVYQAHHDSLTDLLNQAGCRAALVHILDHAVQHRHPVAVCRIDLDRFRPITQSLGPSGGDSLQVWAAERFRSRLHSSTPLARTGNGEYMAILSDLRTTQDAVRIARELLSALDAPLTLDGRDLHVSARIGISFYPQDGTTADELLRHAHTAADRALHHPSERIMGFSAEMTAQVLERLDTEHQLYQALEQQQLELYYQPQYDLQHGWLAGMEALVRWNHPERGLLTAGAFMELVETSDLIFPFGTWVIHEVCRQGAAWCAAGLCPPRLAVNISARQLAQDDFVDQVIYLLKATGFPPHLLTLEITEHVMLHNREQNIAQLRQLRALGIHVSIDDFGIGYSSLAYLQHYPIDTLKIDRSFMAAIAPDGDTGTPTGSTPLVQAIIALARNLRLTAIAEGIETAAQYAYLQQAGCDAGQGFYLSRPLAAAQMTALLDEHCGRAALPDPPCPTDP